MWALAFIEIEKIRNDYVNMKFLSYLSFTFIFINAVAQFNFFYCSLSSDPRFMFGIYFFIAHFILFAYRLQLECLCCTTVSTASAYSKKSVQHFVANIQLIYCLYAMREKRFKLID